MPTSPAAASAPLPRWAQALVWATAVLAVALPVIATLGTLATAGPDVGILSLGLALSSAALVGALIVTRIPGNVVGWLLLAAGLIFGVNLAGQTYVGASLTDHAGTLPLTSLIAWFDNWSFVVGVALVGVYVPLFFPDGRLPSHRRRWTVFVVVATAAIASSQLQVMFASGPLEDEPSVMNPFGVLEIPMDRALLDTLNFAAIALAFAIALTAPAIRFRRAVGIERQQLKWFGSVGIATGLMLIPLLVDPFESDLLWILFIAGLALMPIAIGVAILRYRLYDIDRLVSRTIAYGLLTGGLIAVYLAVNLALSSVFSTVADGNAVVVAASTLAAAALFTPLRRRVQRAVDHRFDRAHYDAESTTMAFSTRLRNEVDLPTVTTDLEATVRDAIAPATLSLWLRPEDAR